MKEQADSFDVLQNPALRGTVEQDVHRDESMFPVGGLSFGQVVDGGSVGVVDAEYRTLKTPSVANTEFKVLHTLSRVPARYVVVRKDRACDVYDGGSAWTESAVFLKATVANAVIALEIA